MQVRTVVLTGIPTLAQRGGIKLVRELSES